MCRRRFEWVWVQCDRVMCDATWFGVHCRKSACVADDFMITRQEEPVFPDWVYWDYVIGEPFRQSGDGCGMLPAEVCWLVNVGLF